MARAGSSRYSSLKLQLSPTAGLGLSISKRCELLFGRIAGRDFLLAWTSQRTDTSTASTVVNLMDGKLWVESIYGKGSRFHFTTMARKSALAKGLLLERLAPWARRHILFIDTLHDKAGVTKLLEELNFQVLVIHDVQDVWTAPTKGDGMPSYDIVIVDSLSTVSTKVTL